MDIKDKNKENNRILMQKIKCFLHKYRALPIQIKASFCFLLCGFLQRGIGIITTPIFTRILTTAEYGVFSVFGSWSGIISVIITLNLFAGVYMQGMTKFENDRAVYSSSLLGLSITLILTWFLIYFTFYPFWNKVFSLTTVQMCAMFVNIALSTIFAFWSTAERVAMRYRSLVILTLLASITNPILGIIFVLKATDKVTARILAGTLVEAVAYSWIFLSIMLRGKKFFSAKYWKYALLFNMPLLPHYLSGVVLASSDRIMISKIVGNSEAGIYNLAYSVSQIMTIFNTAFLQTIEPWLYKKIHEKATENIKSVAYPSFLIIMCVNLILIALAPEIIAIFAPPKYYEAIYVIPSVAMSVVFAFLYTFFAVFEFYCEKTIFVMISTLTSAVANIILNFIFIEIYGYIAAGYTTLACYAIFAGMHYIFMKKLCAENLKIPNPYDIRIISLIIVVFLTIGFIFLSIYDFPKLRYVIISAIIIVSIAQYKKLKLFVLKTIKLK